MKILIYNKNNLVYTGKIKFSEKQKKFIVETINNKTKYFSYKYLASAIINGKYLVKDINGNICDTSKESTIEKRIEIFNKCNSEEKAEIISS